MKTREQLEAPASRAAWPRSRVSSCYKGLRLGTTCRGAARTRLSARSLPSAAGALPTSAELGAGLWDCERPQTRGKFGECEVRRLEAPGGRRSAQRADRPVLVSLFPSGDFAPVGCPKIPDSKESRTWLRLGS